MDSLNENKKMKVQKKNKRMTMKLLFALSIISVTFNSCAQNTRTIGFYNVENLFDTIDGPNDDKDFLPNAESEWNAEKYLTKIKHLNEVIDSMGSPIILGMCEVENKAVVEDIFKGSTSRKHYEIVHYESPDDRGIDVALAFDPTILTLNQSGTLRFDLDNPEHPHTRDILWAKFVINNDTIVAMVNHWPSRRGGQVESEPNRIKAAAQGRTFIDSLMRVSPKTKIVFMGDLNDYPDNMAPKLIAEKLQPMISKESGKFGGTYNYRGEWDVLDHIMISSNFQKGGSIKVVKKSGKILSPDFIITEYKGDLVPKRNYAGSKYLDGYSDHLPVTIDVNLK